MTRIFLKNYHFMTVYPVSGVIMSSFSFYNTTQYLIVRTVTAHNL